MISNKIQKKVSKFKRSIIIKDIIGKLLFCPKCEFTMSDGTSKEDTISGIRLGEDWLAEVFMTQEKIWISVDNIKLILRPMIDMTDAEYSRLNDIVSSKNLAKPLSFIEKVKKSFEAIEYLNSIGVDCRDLLEKDAAVENDDIPLDVPSEKRFVNAIKDLHESEIFCEKCNKVVSVVFYPYGYHKEMNNLYYMGICPFCGSVVYTTD